MLMYVYYMLDKQISILLGQQISLHGSSRVLLPVQGKPSQSDVGLLHVLVSFLIPPPHVLLHDPSVHELHPPSTMEQSKMTECLNYCKRFTINNNM